MQATTENFDPRNLLLFGALISIITAIGLYMAHQKYYTSIVKCYADSVDLASTKSCKKLVEKSNVIPDISLDQSKHVCNENESVVGFDWNPSASVFYESSTSMETDKCDTKLEGSQGTGTYVACVKVPDRKRGYFVGTMVMGLVAVVLLITWVVLWKLD
jgi:hypothetical protein